MGSESSQTAPEDMRTAMADYIRASHQAYVDACAHLAPADRLRLPLFAAPQFTVTAVGTRYLHVVGTQEILPAPQGHEVSINDSVGDLHWVLRFYDPTVIPSLGLIDETDGPAIIEVQDALGLRSTLYHLSIPPGSGLSSHHAQHAGTGLAHSHAAAIRDFDTITALAPHKTELVLEMNSAFVNNLSNAHALLARAIDPHLDTESLDFVTVRKDLIKGLRGAGNG
jgi:hypothetical protein